MKKHFLNILSFLALLNLGNRADCQQPYSLKFDINKFVLQTLTTEGKTFKVRAYENIIDVAHPADTAFQKLNIFIPEEYFESRSINGYTAGTAPIFFPNKVGGYMQASPATTTNNPMAGRPPMDGTMPPAGDKRPEMMAPGMVKMGVPGQSAVIIALSKGYIVASAGARGRSSKDQNGRYIGKAPAGLVDLKAAVRYLKFNDNEMPGDANKIISNGASAGGAMSALLGATGNNPDYEPYLKALGAADATDNIFAVSAYCPITNLDNADMAYEWQFKGINSYRRGGPMQNNSPTANILSKEQVTISAQLKDLFPSYLNSLNLKDNQGNLLSLDKNGNGSFKELVKSYLIASAQKAMNSGTNMSEFSFLRIQNEKVILIDFDGYVKYLERQKSPPAFDAFDLSTPENQVFGSDTVDRKHFTRYATDNSEARNVIADHLCVKMMNPMYYIAQPLTTTARHWRIRHGTKDKDTGLAIPVILGTYLLNNGYDVNIELPWDMPHSGDYDLKELFDWTDSICR